MYIKNSVNKSEIDWRVVLRGMVASRTFEYHYAQKTLLCDKLLYKKAVHFLECWQIFLAKTARKWTSSPQEKFLATHLCVAQVKGARLTCPAQIVKIESTALSVLFCHPVFCFNAQIQDAILSVVSGESLVTILQVKVLNDTTAVKQRFHLDYVHPKTKKWVTYQENRSSKVTRTRSTFLLVLRGCLRVQFCALRLTSCSMCLTDESVEDKLQQNISGYLAA